MLCYTDNPRSPELTMHRILEEQQRDAVLQQVIQHLTSRNSTSKPNWKQFPLKRYSQLLKQLHLVDGVLCRKFVPGPLEEIITVPVMPTSLQEVALRSCHDIISASHQGTEKTLDMQIEVDDLLGWNGKGNGAVLSEL